MKTIETVGLKTYLLAIKDGSTVFRTARKEYRCAGGHDGEKRVPCLVPIRLGDTHIEYTGECGAFQSGKRYHLGCAVQQGLLTVSEH